MQINRLIIENFKGHAHCEVDFQPGFNLLIGDNSTGKTSILEAASVALGGFISGVEGELSKNIGKEDVRLTMATMADGSYNRQYNTPVLISCETTLGNWSRRKSSYLSSHTTLEPADIRRQAKAMTEDASCQLPVLIYQGAGRTWMQNREQSKKVGFFSRTVGYRNCLDAASDPKMLLNWCEKMVYISLQQEKPIREYEAVKTALSTFMSVMNESASPEIRYDLQSSELCYAENGTLMPIRSLSAGYQSIIWMVLDIACRMSVLNPQLLEQTYLTSGVVLIDELDMHLHPKWQWNVIAALQQTFPNVQFIAATHSPILIASCKEGHLIYVERESISYGPTEYGIEVNDVLTYTQGSGAIVKRVKEDLDSAYQLLEEGKLSEADAALQRMETLLGTEHTEVLKLRTALAFEQAIAGEVQ